MQQTTNDEQGKEVKGKDKQPVNPEGEMTHSGRYYQPATDIYEMEDRLVVVMDVPGVKKEDLAITVEEDVLSVDARIDLNKYKDLAPVYTEYSVGHFYRRFTLSNTINDQNIIAQVKNG
ncbi:MAG: Hsp20/alpha crystallin family protein, partial [Gammaproteobacteria bacterium]